MKGLPDLASSVRIEVSPHPLNTQNCVFMRSNRWAVVKRYPRLVLRQYGAVWNLMCFKDPYNWYVLSYSTKFKHMLEDVCEIVRSEKK